MTAECSDLVIWHPGCGSWGKVSFIAVCVDIATCPEAPGVGQLCIRALDAKNRPVIMPVWVPLSCTPQVIVPAVQHASLSIPFQPSGVAVESLSPDSPQKLESCFASNFRDLPSYRETRFHCCEANFRLTPRPGLTHHRRRCGLLQSVALRLQCWGLHPAAHSVDTRYVATSPVAQALLSLSRTLSLSCYQCKANLSMAQQQMPTKQVKRLSVHHGRSLRSRYALNTWALYRTLRLASSFWRASIKPAGVPSGRDGCPVKNIRLTPPATQEFVRKLTALARG